MMRGKTVVKNELDRNEESTMTAKLPYARSQIILGGVQWSFQHVKLEQKDCRALGLYMKQRVIIWRVYLLKVATRQFADLLAGLLAVWYERPSPPA